MGALARAGWRTLELADFERAVRGGSGRPDRLTFLLTFDDGYATLAAQAYPVLADLGFRATTFLVTDYMGRTNAWDARYTWRPLPHLDWATAERWQARGMSFASHTATHPRLTWLADGRVADELGRSRETLQRYLGPGAARALAYPFGAVDGRVERLAQAAGYALGFGGVRGTAGGPLRIPRVPVYLWDAFSVPTGLQNGALGAVGRLVAYAANRCAVGTSVIRRLLGERGAGTGT
jgi:peptidoglycan/xylan/chitin deacetylase (PgdA/CDA1 family)